MVVQKAGKKLICVLRCEGLRFNLTLSTLCVDQHTRWSNSLEQNIEWGFEKNGKSPFLFVNFVCPKRSDNSHPMGFSPSFEFFFRFQTFFGPPTCNCKSCDATLADEKQVTFYDYLEP